MIAEPVSSLKKRRIWMGVLLSGVLGFNLPIALHGQTVPPDRESLENSEGAGMGSYADLNGYPGPKHVLDMQDSLNLSEEQLKDVQSIFDAMKESTRSTGEAIIAREVELESLFRSGKATREVVKRVSKEIGALRGELRAAHLVAHIQAKQVLTKDQIATYDSLRDKERHSTSAK
jgi:Spy/CpxP family protein refolding chaperone